MQVFIIGSPFETAEALDSKRLHKQIIEARQIIQAIQGKTDASTGKIICSQPVLSCYVLSPGIFVVVVPAGFVLFCIPRLEFAG